MMQGPDATSSNDLTQIRARLTKAGYSRRQTVLLEGLFGLCRDEFDRRLEQMLTELEQSLFRSADQARSDEVQRALLQTLGRVREHRGVLKPEFFARLEAAFIMLSDPPPPKKADAASVQFAELSLVDTSAMDEAVALKEIATRSEIRNSLTLFLLGQRVGVVARAPAFDTETLPIGPRHLCQMLRESVAKMELEAEERGLVYREFDRSVVQVLTPFFEALNNYLIAENVLPHLTYVPPRSKQKGRAKGSRQPPLPETTPAHEADFDSGSDSRTTPLPPGPPDMQQIPGRAGGAPGFQPPSQARGASAQAAGFPVPGHAQAGQSQRSASHAGGLDARAAAAQGSQQSGPLHAAPGQHPSPTVSTPAGMFPPMGQSRRSMSPPAATASSEAEQHPAAMGGHEIIPWSHAASEPSEDSGTSDVELFDTLRKLLTGRRGLLDRLKPLGSSSPAATPEQVQEGLAHIQHSYNQHAGDTSGLSFAEIKRGLLTQLQEQAPGQAPVQLSAEQGDTVDLVGMLFEQIAQEVRPQSPGGGLLAQLQLPLLRVALQDQGFFTERSHPARRILEVIAETSAYWSSEDELDRDLIQRMTSLVRRVNEEPSTDPALFKDLMSDLAGHLTTQQRKAEISERRHVEAARGREKLEIARLQAEETVDQVLAGKAVPKFLQTLLQQVWTDVLALALLRGGENAPAFQQHHALVKRLVELATRGKDAEPIRDVEAAQMREEIDAALAQVGYTGDDAKSICDQLLSVTSAPAVADTGTEADTKVEAASRTELTLRLRGRDRLGQDAQKDSPHAKDSARSKDPVKQASPLSDEEKLWHDRLKRLPYGSWFEFTINQQGEKVRRRMSWFSTVTDHCLFVNHRGQRAGDYTLSWLARELQRGNVSLVDTNRNSIVDRAWKAIVTTLRSFSGNRETAAQTAG